MLLKALPPVCIKYTARGESQVANIAQDKMECYICHDTLAISYIISYKQSGSALRALLYFILGEVLTKYAFSFYNYPTTVLLHTLW